jgi:hypothetical protein
MEPTLAPEAAPEAEPFSVKDVIAFTLQGYLGAAALHLGETLADGSALAQPDPQEAWRALLAASGLLDALDRILHEDFRATFEHLLKRLAERHPDLEFPIPQALLAGRQEG